MKRALRIIVDMNLSPLWVPVLQEAGYESDHWMNVGPVTVTDKQIMSWAVENGYIVFSHDLDFSHLLAATGDSGPSVIQVRGEDVMPDALASQLLRVLDQCKDELKQGALISLDLYKARVRILPLRD